MSAPSAAAPNDRWLYGPAPDLILGGGLVYLPLFGILLFAGPKLEHWLPISLMPLVILAFNTPHIGATLLRVYERDDDRRAYSILALYLTAALAALYFIGLYVPIVGSVMISVYVTVIPWHFTGQNYGIAILFLRRRGIEVQPATKRLIYLSFVLTYAMTLVALHGEILSDAYAPHQVAGTQYVFLALGLPKGIIWFLLAILGIGYLGCTSEALFRLRRVATWREIAPTAATMLTQALWYAVPLLVYFVMDPHGIFPLDAAHYTYTFLWITQVHAVQYLWITSYYARRRDPSQGHARYLGKALLAGTAVYGLPALLLSPSALGSVPFDSGLFLMLAGALNLHHVLLDSAIWKLRSGRVAKVLLRPAEPVAAQGPPSRSWLRPAIWASGALGLALMVYGTLESHYGTRSAIARGDLPRLEESARRLAWIGRQDPDVYTEIASLRIQGGDLPGAIAALEEGIALHPTSAAWANLGRIHESHGDLGKAREAYRSAMELDPEQRDLLQLEGRLRRQAMRASTDLPGATP